MVRIESIAGVGKDAGAALAHFNSQIVGCALEPGFAFLFYSSEHQDDAVFAAFRSRYPLVPLVGGTSCSGVMTECGLAGDASIGVLLVEDADGEYGAASAAFGSDPSGAAECALKDALDAAGCPGELPELIWVYQAPGQEEAVIEGLRRIVGDRCPIIGGSSADQEVAGDWRQLGPDGPLVDGLAVGVLFSSGGIGFAFQGGYEPTGPSGVVTRIGYDPTGVSGIATHTQGRHIVEIDGRAAAEVYNEWTGGALTERIDQGGSILADTTLCPIGVDSEQSGDVPHYLLVHPAEITPERGLKTFATVVEGARIYAMKGERRRLVERAGRVATTARQSLAQGGSDTAGGLIVYCGGCRMAVGDEMPGVVSEVADSFGPVPFLGCFTFGEQGSVLQRNVHGNLMISAVVFGR
jgi:hypothetical protein